MSAAHDEPEDVALVHFSSQLLEGERRLEAALQTVQLLDELIVVELDQVSEMFFALFRGCARQEEVSQLHSWSSNPCSLEVHNGQVGGVGLIFVGVSVTKQITSTKSLSHITERNETSLNLIIMRMGLDFLKFSMSSIIAAHRTFL